MTKIQLMHILSESIEMKSSHQTVVNVYCFLFNLRTHSILLLFIFAYDFQDTIGRYATKKTEEHKNLCKMTCHSGLSMQLCADFTNEMNGKRRYFLHCFSTPIRLSAFSKQIKAHMPTSMFISPKSAHVFADSTIKCDYKIVIWNELG